MSTWGVSTSVVLLFLTLFLLRRSLSFPCERVPHGKVSDLRFFAGHGKSWRCRFQAFPYLLYGISLFLLAIALTDPRLDRPLEVGNLPYPSQGVAIYLLLDISGSMAERGGLGEERKIDRLKEVTRKFLFGDPAHGMKGRYGDMVGLLGFARTAHLLSPLTLDHRFLLRKIEALEPLRDPNQGGTVLGYAIYKAVQLIAATRHFIANLGKKAPYTMESAILIAITDGLHDPNPLDKENRLRSMGVEEACRRAVEEGVRIYLINVDPRASEESFAPYRREMDRLTAMTKGRFYLTTTMSLESIYREIDRLEKNSYVVRGERVIVSQHVYRGWLLAALFFLMMAFSLQVLWFREVP